ncbi:MAG: hypothetical protein E5Y81_04830 [Mesorhizobium sp.]|nr:MAG: hypothetical protein E5Y81_04830 [Mesorhizobium sp.]
MIRPPRRQGEYADREIDCQEAMEPGFQAIVGCMLETAGRAERGAARDRPRLSAPAGREMLKRSQPTTANGGLGGKLAYSHCSSNKPLKVLNRAVSL